MTLAECTAALTPYVLAYRATFDAPTYRAYFRVLEKLPVSLLTAALERHSTSGATFFPTAPELVKAAELTRRALIDAHPYTGCADCEHTLGFRQRLDVPNTVERCPCRQRHQDKLAGMGLLEPVGALADGDPKTWQIAEGDR